jgi:sugar lactone lactonase YvrE
MEMKILDSGNRLVGEGPLYDEKNNTLYALDIRSKSVIRTDLATGAQAVTTYPQEIGCIALTASGRLLAGMTDGIYYLREDGTLEAFLVPEKLAGRRFNDGKVGPDGHYYIGTISTATEADAAFYHVSPAGEMEQLLFPVGNSNGLAWNKEATLLYYCDTRSHQIDVFDFDGENHSIRNRRCVIRIPAELGSPDGMTIDDQGHLWVALWAGSGLLHIDPTEQKILEKLPFPAKNVTCCTFVGEDFSQLAVTSAAFGTDPAQNPREGNTFLIQPGVRGLPTNRFRDI